MRKCQNPSCHNDLPPEKLFYCCEKCRKKVNNMRSKNKEKIVLPEADKPQRRIILAILTNSTTALTARQVLTKMYNQRMLLTSVHRALADLTKLGLIVKTGNKVRGEYGVWNDTWAYNWKR